MHARKEELLTRRRDAEHILETEKEAERIRLVDQQKMIEQTFNVTRLTQ